MISSKLFTVISIHALREEGDLRQHKILAAAEISIHALREEGDIKASAFDRAMKLISIHALREEGDLERGDVQDSGPDISIHALREEGDVACTSSASWAGVFLSTPSARRATGGVVVGGVGNEISIHALREEGDVSHGEAVLFHVDFYPRPPRGGRQQKQRQNLYFQTNYTTFCTNLEEP